MADADTLRVPFSLRRISGLISASVTPNTDPAAIGYSLLTGGLPVDAARGFPDGLPRLGLRPGISSRLTHRDLPR